MMTNSASSRIHIFCFFILLCFALFLHYPLFKIQGFMPKDDWKPLRYTQERPYHPQLEQNIQDFGFANLKWEWNLGRFTPVFNLVQVLEAHAFKTAPLLWHLETLGLALFSAALLYLIFISLGISIFPALLGGMWFLARGQELWVEKQYQEDTGVLLILLAVYLFIRAAQDHRSSKLDWAALTIMVLAGFTKETFVFLYPALLLFRIFLDCCLINRKPLSQNLRRLRTILIAGGLIFVGQMLLILFLYLRGPYAQGVVGALFEFRGSQITRLFSGMSANFSYFLPALGLFLVIPAVRQKRIRSSSLLMAALCLAFWLLSQIFIFKSHGFAGHYIFSAIPGFITLNVLGLETLKRHNSKLAQGVFFGLCLCSLYTICLSFPDTRNVAELQVARANVYAAARQQCFDSLHKDSSILLFSDRPWWGLGASFLFDLSREGEHCPVYFIYPDLPQNLEKWPERTSVGRDLLTRYFPPLMTANRNTIDIVFAVYPAHKFLEYAAAAHYPWFMSGDWTEFSFQAPFTWFDTGSLFHPAWNRLPRKLEYTIFVRNK